MEYNLHHIQQFADRPVDFALFLATEGFIVLNGVTCNICEDHPAMNLQYYGRLQDGVCLACKRGHRKSVRGGSFFQDSNLSLFTQFELLITFASEASANAAANTVGVNEKTARQFFDKCRVIYGDNIAYDPIVFTDGPEFEVDELVIKRIKTVDGVIISYQWVMGLLERSTGKVIYIPVPDRTAAILVPKVHAYIPQGSFVFSDELASYHSVAGPYRHHTVNHSNNEYERIDVVDGQEIHVHINTLEGVNSVVRSRLRNRSKRTLVRLHLYLKELMYRKSGRGLFDPFKLTM